MFMQWSLSTCRCGEQLIFNSVFWNYCFSGVHDVATLLQSMKRRLLSSPRRGLSYARHKFWTTDLSGLSSSSLRSLMIHDVRVGWTSCFCIYLFILQIIEMVGMPQRDDRVTAMFSATFPKEIQVRIRYRRLSCEVVTRFVDIGRRLSCEVFTRCLFVLPLTFYLINVNHISNSDVSGACSGVPHAEPSVGSVPLLKTLCRRWSRWKNTTSEACSWICSMPKVGKTAHKKERP